MRLIQIIVFMSLAYSTAYPANEPKLEDTKIEESKAEELLVAIKGERNVAALKQSANALMVELVRQTVRKMRFSNEEVTEFKLALDSKTRALLSELAWEKVKPLYIKIYAETFTEQEIVELLAFYRSPVGIKFMERQEEINRLKAEVTREVMAGFEPKIHAVVDQVVEDLQKKSKKPSP